MMFDFYLTNLIKKEKKATLMRGFLFCHSAG